MKDCREEPRTEKRFGLCDDGENKPAYSDFENELNWLAVVRNEFEKEIIFTAIDKCLEIFKQGTTERESTCDGMLTFENSLYLVELKNDRTKGWQKAAVSQLKNTIKLLPQFCRADEFNRKKAFVCNRRHPNFHRLDNAEQKSFFEETRFRLDVNAEIIVK